MAASICLRSANRIPIGSFQSFAVKSRVASAPSIRRFAPFSRFSVELGCCGVSLFPFHSAAAAARMTSQLSLASRSTRTLSQVFVCESGQGP